MFDVAQGVCATLLTEAAVTLKDDRLQEMAIRWKSPKNRGERSDSWLLDLDSTARL